MRSRGPARRRTFSSTWTEKEVGLAGHRAARVAGLIREMDTLAEMTAESCSLFSGPVEAAAASEAATSFDVSDHTLNRALAWAWAVCGEVTEVTANRSQLTQMLPRIALFTDAFPEILTSNPAVRRSAPAASTGGRAASSQRNSDGAASAAAAPSRGHVPPSNVADLLLGFGLVDDGGEAADGNGPDERGQGRMDDDDDDERGSATGGPALGAAAPPAPPSPDRDAHIRPRIAQTPDGHTSLRHMPTLRAALGRDTLSFTARSRRSRSARQAM